MNKMIMNKNIFKTVAMFSFAGAILATSQAFALKNFDTSKIPSKPSSTIRLESGYIYDFGGREIDGSNIKDNGLFRCFDERGVAVRNVTVTNNPRYAFLGKGCNDIKISNFHMKNMSGSVGGIRFAKGTANSTVKIVDVTANNVGGHAIELWDANGFTIGGITANNTDGCGVLLNRSRNGVVGTVKGNANNRSGGYATFRVANNAGPNISVSRVISRNSGRGFFSVSGSEGVTVNLVDIDGANKEGIYIQDSKSILVKSGKVRGTTGNCRIRGGSDNSIKANCGGTIYN